MDSTVSHDELSSKLKLAVLGVISTALAGKKGRIIQYPFQFFRITHNLNTVALMMKFCSTWALGQILHLVGVQAAISGHFCTIILYHAFQKFIQNSATRFISCNFTRNSNTTRLRTAAPAEQVSNGSSWRHSIDSYDDSYDDGIGHKFFSFIHNPCLPEYTVQQMACVNYALRHLVR